MRRSKITCRGNHELSDLYELHELHELYELYELYKANQKKNYLNRSQVR